MFKKIISLSFFCLAGTIMADLQYRTAIDLGSGAVKMQSAWVDNREGRIVKMCEKDWVPMRLRDALDRDPNHAFSEETIQRLIDVLAGFKQKSAQKDISNIYLGTATESFRLASNGRQVLDRIEKELGIRIYCLSQEEEAILGHQALWAEGLVNRGSSYILWENGGGSLQISSKTKEGFKFYNRSIGKVTLTNYLLEQVQGKDIRKNPYPNPISSDDFEKTLTRIKSELKDIPSWLKESLSSSETDVIGFSAMFPSAIIGLEKRAFTKTELRRLIDERIGKKGEDFSDGHSENQPFVLSDMIFLYSIMDAIGIEKIQCPEKRGPGSTSGLLVNEEKWSSQ